MPAPRKSGTQRGGRKKPPGTAQGHRKDNVVDLAVHQGGKLAEIPDPPTELGKTATKVWETFWQSPVATQVEDSDWYALRRWIGAVQELQEHKTTIDRMGVTVEGSTGQVRMHPLFARVEKLEEQIGKFETQFGMTPLARLKLGLTLASGALTAEKVNQIAKEQRNRGNQSTVEAEAQDDKQAEVIDAEVIEGYEPA